MEGPSASSASSVTPVGSATIVGLFGESTVAVASATGNRGKRKISDVNEVREEGAMKSFPIGPVYTLRVDRWSAVQLRNAKKYEGIDKKPVFIRLRVAASASIQHVMHTILREWRWNTDHLYSFEMNGRKVERAAFEKSSEECLGDFEPRVGGKLRIVYDFGANWEWMGSVEAVHESGPAGQGSSPATLITVLEREGRAGPQYEPNSEDAEDEDDDSDAEHSDED
jgi:hypothetical protein